MEPDIYMASKEKYQENLTALYENAKEWLLNSSIIISYSSVILLEDNESYSAPVLVLSDKKSKQKIAELRPFAAQVIGAQGRVDIIGTVDKQILLYLVPPATGTFRTTVTTGGPFITASNIEENWYWIESGPVRKPHSINKSLFMDLITAVSDYDARQHA